MFRSLILALLVCCTSVKVSAVEVSPEPPTPTIPLAAGRIVHCVGVDNAGNAYCNVAYLWRVKRNRFCCTYQRELTAIVALDGGITWLTPSAPNTDTRVLSVSNDGRYVVGLSITPRYASQGQTLWVDGVPGLVAGTVSAVSNYGYTLSGLAVRHSDGTTYSPASCVKVLALDDLGGGVCFKDFDPGNDDPGVRGVARFDDPEQGEGNLTRFIIPLASPQYVKTAAINNYGLVALTVATSVIGDSYSSDASGLLISYPGVYFAANNDSGFIVGSGIWQDGTGGVSADGVLFLDINNAGVTVGRVVRDGYTYGLIIYN